jgi:hypothetical protein
MRWFTSHEFSETQYYLGFWISENSFWAAAASLGAMDPFQ